MKQKLAVAVDLGASNARVALISSQGNILSKTSEPTRKNGTSGKAITDQIVALIHHITKTVSKESLAGIGIASIGPLDYTKGGPVHSPNIPYPFVSLIQPLEKEFSCKTVLHNDTNAAVLGEKYFGAGTKIENLVYITISTGIGGGAVVNGNLLLGKSGNAAEIGHMITDTAYNLPCGCNKGTGHWESLASGNNLPHFFETWAEKNKKARFPVSSAKDIFEQAKKHNAPALEFLDELAKINARALSTIIVAYDPELITIGGSVALRNPVIINSMRPYIDRYLKLPAIRITKLGEDISLLGASAAVFQKKHG